MNAPRSIRVRLLERFRDKRYRRVYVEDFLNTSIASQIQALRKARKLSQKDLAAKIGTKQNGISRLEDVNYTGWRVGTLKKLARAFDVVLVVRFESFGSALDDIATFGKQELLVPSFDADPVFAPEAGNPIGQHPPLGSLMRSVAALSVPSASAGHRPGDTGA